MRAIAQRFVDDVEIARGTPQEATVVTAASTGLQDALTWVTSAGSAVLGAAPTLDDDIQLALDGLSSTGSFTMTGRSQAFVFVHDAEPANDNVRVDRGTSVSASSLGISVSLAARQENDTIVFDAGAVGRGMFSPEGWHSSGADMWLELRFARPGILTLISDGAWPGQPYPWTPDLAVGMTVSPLDRMGGYAESPVLVSSLAGSDCVVYTCRSEIRVAANATLILHVSLHMQHAYQGPAFTFNASPARAIFTPGSFPGPNRPPTAIAQSLAAPSDTPVSVRLEGDDLDGDALTFTVTGGPASGVLSGSAPNVVYLPNAGFQGFDQFSFTVFDGTYASEATVYILVGEPPLPPSE
jgi:hypothetical protein